MPHSSHSPEDPVAIAPIVIARWLEAGEVVLVDVRETREYDLEHIAGALLMPLSELDGATFPVLAGIPVVLHCAVGKRSAAAGRILSAAGHEKVLHMEGGLAGWKEAGLPVEEAIAPPAQTAPVARPHPGQVLREVYLEASGLGAGALAAAAGIAPGKLEAVIAGARPVDAEMSLRLARYFSTAADFWLQLQIDHDLERARHALDTHIRAAGGPRAA